MSDPPAAQTQAWTIARLLDWTRRYFAEKQVDEPRLSAEILLSTALACKRIELYTRFDHVPKPKQLDVFRDLVRQAANHTPIAYLVGAKEFYSLEFEVSPAVLIPRPETEILVQQLVEHARAAAPAPFHALDFGTGSGCIAITLLKHVSHVCAVGSDVSPDALLVAQRNAERHGVADRVGFVEAKGLDLPDGTVPAGGFDVIASNPPYVASGEWGTLEANVREHEPSIALTDHADGLAFFRLIAAKAPALLSAGGAIFVEVGDGQAKAVQEIFEHAGRFEPVATWRDEVGPHERVVHFRLIGGGD